MADVNVTIDYEARVTRALAAGKQVLEQFDKLSNMQKQQVEKAAEFSKQIEQLNKTGPRAFRETGKAVSELGDQLARLGVFANKTFATMAGSIQSVGTALKGALSGVGQGAGGALGAGSSLISEFSRSLTDFIGTGGFIQKLGNAVAAGTGGLVRVGAQIGSLIIRGIGEVASTVPKLIGELTQFGGAAAGLISGVGATLFKAGGIAVGLFVSGVANAAGSVVKAFGSIFEGVTSLAVSTFSGLGNLVASALQGTIGVVSAIADRIATTIGDAVGQVADAVGKTLAGALAIALPAAFKASEFRDGLGASFGVVIDEIDKTEFERLVSGAKRVAARVGVELSQVPQALFKLVSPGFKGTAQSLLDFEAAAKLAAVGNVQLFSAIDTINQVIDTYGKRAGNAAEVSNKLFNATRLGRIEIQDLTQTLGFVAGSAEFAGIQFDELLTVINLVRRTLPASTSVLGLANAIKSLGSPSVQAARDFKEFYEAVRNADGSIKSFKVVVDEIRSRGFQVDSAAFRDLFPDERGARAIKALLSATKDDFAAYNQVLKDINGSNVAFQKTSEFALDTIAKRAQSVSTSFLSLIDAVLEKFKGPIISGFDAFAGVLQRAEDQIKKLDTTFVGTISRSVIDFVDSIPRRLSGIKEIFENVFAVIQNGARVVRQFADEQLNLTIVLRNLFSGDIETAFDALIGSRGVARIKSFFSTIKAEFLDGINFIKSIVLTAVSSISAAIGGVADATPGFGLAKALTPSSLTTGSINPTELGLQTVAGVNPVQSTARTASSIIGGAAKGGAAGAAIGSVIPGVGTAIGGTIGAIGGALIEWYTTTKQIAETQKGIRDVMADIEKATRDQLALQKTRREVRGTGDALVGRVDDSVSRAIAIQSEITAKINESLIAAEPKQRRITELTSAIEETEKEIFAVKLLGYDNLEQWAEIVGKTRAAAKIEQKQAERTAEVARLRAETEAGFRARIADVDAKILAAKEKVASLIKPPSDLFTRSLTYDVTSGLALGGGIFSGTTRSADLSGGPAESRLINAIEALIDALESNESAQRALKDALDPKNLNENIPGLNTRARAEIRRNRRERERALAETINERFSGAPASSADAGIFGIGGSSSERFLRAAAFGGEAGFGAGLPGERGGFSRDRAGFLGETLPRLADARLPRFGSTGLIDVAELLTGAPSASGRVRGRRSPFAELSKEEITKLRESIIELAKASEIFGKGADARKGVDTLIKTEAGRLGPAATDSEVLSKVLDSVKQVIEFDKEDKKVSKEAADLKKAKKELAGEESAKADLESKLKGAGDTAEARVPKVDEEGITKSAVEDATAEAKAKSDALEENKKELTAVQDELKKIADESLVEIGELQKELLVTMKDASTTMSALADTSLDIFNKFNDIGQDFLDASNILQKKIDVVYSKTSELEKSVGDMNRRLKGP